VSTLAEIETAICSLSEAEKRELQRFLYRELERLGPAQEDTKRAAVEKFLQRWRGALTPLEGGESDRDPRFSRLVAKHVK
jgi:hypothetical protein